MSGEDNAEAPVRTLVVDDVERLRSFVADALADANGFEVAGQAADGEEAIKGARELDLDLVLLDLSMPRMDGLETMAEIRRQAPGVEVVVLSGFDSERMEAVAKDRGALAYIEKGIGSDELVRRLSGLFHDGPSSCCAPSQRQAAQPDPKDPTPAHVHVHILVLDGSPSKQLAHSLRTSRPDWTLTSARGKQRTQQIPASTDVVVVSVQRCGRPWETTVRSLAARDPETPVVVAVSGMPEGCLPDALQAGATDVVDLDTVDEEAWAHRIRWALLVNDRHQSRTRRLDMLAGTMAHDLRQPLRALDKYADWIQQGLGLDDQDRVETALEGLQRGVERARRLIDSQLTYAQLRTRSPTADSTDPREAIEQALSDLDKRIEASGATIQLATLPRVLAPPEHLVVLFRNLIVNAIKYREPASSPAIEVWGEARGDEVRIHVSDDGIGIDPEYQDEIFDPFTRLHAEEDYPGTGLGLAICQEIVEQQGGAIEVDSEPGEGTTMSVRLPKPVPS